jgi:alkylated DNA repair dioxygenase AlkB
MNGISQTVNEIDSHACQIGLRDADVWLLHRLELARPAAAVLQDLIDHIPWRQETIRLFGRVCDQPRLIAWHGDPGAAYRYSGLRLEPTAWTPLLADLRDRVGAAAGAAFNAVLLNYYRDGRDSMGLHSDDEPELGPEPVIASLSLGAERRMVFRHRTERSLRPVRLALPAGSLLVMRGATQANWKHGIEKQSGACGPRVNLTFRRIVEPSRRGSRAQAKEATNARD